MATPTGLLSDRLWLGRSVTKSLDDTLLRPFVGFQLSVGDL
jgi:hypothetical protein